MQTYTEDSITIYEGLEGEVDAYKLFPHIEQSFHGVVDTSGPAFVGATDNNFSRTAEEHPSRRGDGEIEKQYEQETEEVENPLKLIRLLPHVKSSDPTHIVGVETAASTPPNIRGLVRNKHY